jgi:hypothetical protein
MGTTYLPARDSSLLCFWLKGEEDPDPAKADQYARWRELRKLQGANEAGTELSDSVRRSPVVLHTRSNTNYQ